MFEFIVSKKISMMHSIIVNDTCAASMHGGVMTVKKIVDLILIVIA